MTFRCLILDHDDTAVDSTREIHYPAHVEVMERLRPEREPITLEEWYRKNFDPGIMSYLVDELALSPEELETEFTIWRSYTTTRVPHFYPGFLELLSEFAALGGRLAIVSHSERGIIERDYLARSADAAGGAAQPIPELIYGWDHDERRRKPSPWPVEQILQEFGIDPSQALIVDDLKPAVIMGRASGVRVAAAGWSHDIPEIRDYMERNCFAFLSSVEELRTLIMD